MIVYTLLSTKGGVGKTTLAASIGSIFADFGLRVLLIDADYQPALSKFFHFSHVAPKGLTALLTGGALVPEAISTVEVPPPEGYATARQGRVLNPSGKLDLVYTDAPTGEAEIWLTTKMNYFMRLRQVLHNPLVADLYDVVIIDTQGATGKLQDAAAVAADRLILPVSPDTLSTREFLTTTMDLLDRLSSTITHQLPTIQAILYKQSNTNNSREIATAVRERYRQLRGNVSVLNTVIPVATAFERSASLRLPVHWIDKRASQLMHELAWELVPQFAGVNVSDVVSSAASSGSPSLLEA